MRRSPAALAAVAALALAGAACTKAPSTAPGALFRQPSSVAAFRGRTIGDPTTIKPYLVVANQTRNDLSILDGVADAPVPAPIKLRALVLTVLSRPTLVAAASLGDDPTNAAKADVLVAVAGGDSVLQLVETWNAANLVHSDPAEQPAPLAVDLGYDVLALAVVPSPPGTARIAAALANHRVAVVTYARGADGQSIAPVSPAAISAPLPFQPVALAAMPGDPAQTALYAATLDPIATDASGAPVYGVEEISLAGLVPTRALGARAPTRLVAAARLQERIAGADVSGNPLPGSAASDPSAFVGRPVVPRVYAVLDESGCGPSGRIDCGVVTLDASPAVISGTVAIPQDDPFMPYRAPMRIPGRPLALAAAGPPAVPPPPAATGELDFTTAALGGYMRLYSASAARATTAVGAVASDDGYVYFLDLGRFETAATDVAIQTTAAASMPPFTPPALASDGTACTALKAGCGERRLWLEDKPGGTFLATEAAVSVPGPLGVAPVVVTPGWSPDEQWAVVYQGLLSPDLFSRMGEAGLYDPVAGVPWLALQVGAGGVRFDEVVRLWDPAFGVAPGDIVIVKARAVGCEGTPTGSTGDLENQFEVEVNALLPPAPAYPGGAVTLRHRTIGEDPKWAACYAALVAKTAGGSTATGLIVTVRAGGYVLTAASNAGPASVRVDAGYVGRPQPNVAFTLLYRNEDTLAAACPLAGWSWQPPAPACDATCRSNCEALAIARKLRRLQGISVDCGTNAGYTTACTTAWPGNKFPLVASPVALAFTFDVQPSAVGGDATPFRDLRLAINSRPGFYLLQAIGKSTSPYQASGIASFDRSPWDATSGYRFLVPYPADFVLDATPSQSGAPSAVIR